jgi:superfamily II DNA/RNA helicase
MIFWQTCSDVLGFNSQYVAFDIKLPGRSGRAGRSGQAVTFYTEDDVPLLRSVAHVIFASGGDVPAWMLNLPKVHKHKFKPHTTDSNGVSSASEVTKKKQQSKSPQKSQGRKSEGFRKTQESTKQENGMAKKNFKASSKNQKTLLKKNTKSFKRKE